MIMAKADWKATETLHSDIDASVNFVTPFGEGNLESRYVRREKKYFSCYLSSQSGCNRGCKFCHLTSNDATMFDQAGIDEFIRQAEQVFSHYDKQEKAEYVHYNWMARGEALCNPTITEESDKLLWYLYTSFCKDRKLSVKYNISTIMPKTIVGKSLVDMFPCIPPTIYYSLYSTEKAFCNQWLPGAMGVDIAMEMLKEYQQYSKKIVKLHYALIEGGNDSFLDSFFVAELIKKYNLFVELNLVLYNPPDGDSQESEDYEDYENNIKRFAGQYVTNSKIVTRVGRDVAASCGTFITE